MLPYSQKYLINRTTNNKKDSMFLVLLAYAIFSVTFTLGKQAMSYGQPLLFVAFRMLFAGTVLVGYQYFFTREKFKINKEDWPYFLKIMFFQIYVAYCLQYWALPFVKTTKWALIYTIAPFASAFFSYLHFSEKVTIRKFIGLIIALSGLLPVLLVDAPAEDAVMAVSFISWPEIAIFVSAIAFSYGWIVTRRLTRKNSYSSVMINGITMIGGGLLSLITSPFVDQWSPSPVVNWSAFLQIVVIISIFSILYYVLNTSLLKRYTATFLSLMSAIDPLYVAFYSWIYLGETVSPRFFISIAVIFVGIYTFYQEEISQGYIVK